MARRFRSIRVRFRFSRLSAKTGAVWFSTKRARPLTKPSSKFFFFITTFYPTPLLLSSKLAAICLTSKQLSDVQDPLVVLSTNLDFYFLL
jgi:hypothetical protein